MEPECSEVINGPNLGGFLGLAPDLRRLGRQGLAWLSGTQGLSGPGIWASPKERLCCDPAGNGSLAGLRTSFTTRLSLSLHARTSQLRISREQRIFGGEFFLLGFS